jgi:hypothetical protein
MKNLQQALEETNFSQMDEEAGARLTEEFRQQLTYFLRFYDVWTEIEGRDFQLDNLHQQLLEDTVYTPSTFTEVCNDGWEGMTTLYGLIDRNGLTEPISSAIAEVDHSEYNSFEYLYKEGLHLEDPDEIEELMKIKPRSEPFPSENSIQLWESESIELLTEGADFLKYAGLYFESEYISQGYEFEMDMDEFQRLNAWTVDLQKRLGSNYDPRPDGGSPTITTIAGTAGQIVAGAYALGHDSFIDVNHASIIAGTGLISSGLNGWPDNNQLEQELEKIQERLDELD